MAIYTVIVGNIGTVHVGTNRRQARAVYRGYIEESKRNLGRAAGEPVTMLADEEIFAEFNPHLNQDQA
jgi:hypothetical protein